MHFDYQRKQLNYEFYMHLGFFLAAVAVVTLSFTMTIIGSQLVCLPGYPLPVPESCTARLLLGMDCPGCGLTRAFISISHGQFRAAWDFNPAAYFVYLFVLVQLPWQLYQMRRNLKGIPSYERSWIYILPIAAALLLVIQWLVRLVLCPV